jgi:hypothetical protein
MQTSPISSLTVCIVLIIPGALNMWINRIKLIVLLISIFSVMQVSGCAIASPQQELTNTTTPSPTAQPPTVTLTNTPTITPSAMPKPPPSFTPTTTPSHTHTPESRITPLPDGTLQGKFGSLDIIGTEVFIMQTSQALTLIKDKAPDAYLKIETYVGVIEQGEHSGMWAWENPPRYEVGQRTADSTTTWYASTIAHDAVHSELYHEYLAQNGEPVPDDAWASVEAERFCIAYQLKVLKEIDGPEYEIEYLESQTGTHCDVDNDGDCDWDDYDNRDW